MSRQITTTIYKFSELNEDAKQKAIEKFSDINVDYNWWKWTYEDAERIGLKITGFDIDRGGYCDGEFTLTASEVAQNVLNQHFETCGTCNTAKEFMKDWQPVFSNYMDETHEDYESGESEDKLMELEEDFKKSLCEDYRIILQREYEYLTSEAAIIDTIEANGYEFTEDGDLA